jgi:hypothetical protein
MDKELDAEEIQNSTSVKLSALCYCALLFKLYPMDQNMEGAEKYLAAHRTTSLHFLCVAAALRFKKQLADFQTVKQISLDF